MDVIYEDNHLLAINKPAGVLTQANGTNDTNLEDQARKWIKERYGKPGKVFLHAVHRLDRPASGIVLFARTSKALSRLNASMRAKDTSKHYYAIVCGIPDPHEQVLENYMVHGEHRANIVHKGHPEASIARLTYHVVDVHEKLALVKIELETGRYHQIRLQMSTIGCPILGDIRYGGDPWDFGDRIALHHHQLQIPHPTTKQMLTLTASAPSYWPFRPQP